VKDRIRLWKEGVRDLVRKRNKNSDQADIEQVRIEKELYTLP
jgi:hypothetical protein